MIDNRNAVRHAFGFLHVVRGEKDRDLLLLVELLDVGPKLVARLWIEAKSGFVEEDDLRRVQKTARDFEASPHPAGELLDRVLAPVPQLKQLEQLLDAFVAELARNAVQHAVEVHVLVGGQFVVDAGVLEYDPELLARAGLIPHGVDAVEGHTAARGFQQRSQHLDGSGLAGAVGAEEGENLALGHLKGDVVDGDEIAEFLHQPLGADHAMLTGPV